MKDLEGVKKWLSRAGEAERELELLSERLELLKNRSEGVSHITGMPHGTDIADHTAGIAIRIIETEKEIAKAEKAYKRVLRATKKGFTEGLAAEKAVEKRLVMTMRYIDGCTWGDIIFSLFGNEDDFIEREDSYSRRTYRLHEQALKELSTYLSTK